MNGKKAKRLRKIAKSIIEFDPNRDYDQTVKQLKTISQKKKKK